MFPDLGLVNLVFISGLVCATTSESVMCPDSSQWSLRTRAFCNSTHPSLNCLYEETTSTFVQFCTPRPDFQRPGYKFIIRGNIDGIECEKNRFQPIKFWTNGSSDCILEKTHCNEPGQVIHVDGDSKSDRTCRCDYTKGFAFVSQKQGDCFCDPSLEDCSCFLKPCRKFQVMTPDYSCIDAKDWTGIFKCPVIKKTVYMTTSATTRCPTPSTEKNQFRMGLMVATKLDTIALTVCSALTVIIVVVVIIFHRKIQECRNRQLTNEKLAKRLEQLEEQKLCGKLQLTDEKLEEKFEQWTKQKIGVNQRIAEDSIEERLKQWRKRKLNDQAAFEKKVKDQSSNYIDIITGINTLEILDTLSSNKWMTDSEKKSINEFHGRRQKNKALLELALNRECNGYKHLIQAIVQSHSNNRLELEKKIEDLKGFLEEKSNNEKKPKSVKDLEEFLINDKIPEDVRNVFETYFKTWYKDDERFTVTKAACEIEKNLEQNNCVLVVGRSGNGKSAIIRHIALKLFNEEGYDVVPIVLDLSTILQYHDPNRKQLFVLDDFCGKVETNDQTVQMSSVNIDEVMELIKNPINADGSVKLLLATQPFLFENYSFNSVNCLSNYKVYLSEFPLENQEKIDMIKKYLPKDHAGHMPSLSRHNEDIVPLLCKLSEGKTAKQMIQLFNDPDQVIKKDFFALKQTNKKQICLLSLCVLFKSLTKDIFSHGYTSEKDEIIKLVCSEFDLDFSEKNTKSKLQAELTYLEKTYFVKSGDTYYFVHKDIYNIAAVSCGVVLKNIFIRFAYSSFIAERYSFVSTKTKEGENIICIDDKETQQRYFDRLWNDLGQGITYSMFHNRQLEDKAYRTLFCTYCYGREKNFVKLLNRLQNWASEPPKNRCNNQIVSRKDSVNDYEDYMDFNNSWQFSSHNMKIPLIESAWEGYNDIVKMLIDLEPDINETDRFGRSALFVACRRGMVDVANLLLDKTADHTLCEANGQSPLYAACIGGHTKIVENFLKREAITSKCDKNGSSPLHAASATGQKTIVEKLLVAKAGVDISQCDNRGRSALFVASDNGHKDVVKVLLEKHANIDDCDIKGFSPLMAACSKKHLGVVEVMITWKSKSIKINYQDYDRRSALFMACKKGHHKIVDLLLKHGASMLCDSHGQSPLFIASYFGHKKVVELLIKVKDADKISHVDEEGKTPLFIACEKGKENIVNILLPKWLSEADNKKRSPLYIACKGGFKEIVEKLVKKGAEVNTCNIWKETPLFAASREGHTDVVKYLINKNADLKSAESNKHTPLWIACDEGHVEIVKILVEKGADINLLDNDNRSPLFAASRGDHMDVVSYLIDKNANLNSKDSNGHTPLWIACDEGHVKIVRILVEKGADINLQDIKHMKGHTEIDNILKQKMLQEQKTVDKDVKE